MPSHNLSTVSKFSGWSHRKMNKAFDRYKEDYDKDLEVVEDSPDYKKEYPSKVVMGCDKFESNYA